MKDHAASRASEKPVIVSFVIPALNEERFIRRCLESICQLTLPAGVSGVEVIVVDNESTDRTVEISQSLGARVLSTPPGRASRARNLGAAVAVDDFIAFIDADCEVLPNWLELCLPLFFDMRVVAVGCRITPPSSAGSWVTRALGRLNERSSCKDIERVNWIASAGVLIRRSDFTSVGGFDERLTTCEDCDLGYKLSERGSLLVNHNATLVHHGESTTLAEVFRREAWRTNDNLRLALNRPYDYRNWASLLLPLAYTLTASLGMLGSVAAFLTGASLMPWLLLLCISLLTPTAIVVIKCGWSNPALLFQASAVLSTYFLGRTVGCLCHFPRVERGGE